MCPRDFRKSIDFLVESVFPRMGIGKDHTLTIEYLGGEILLIPKSELDENVKYARDKIRPLVNKFRDGAQSNLITTPRKAIGLHDLFAGNIGTSWDNHTDQRTIGGSAKLYRAMLENSLKALSEDRDSRPGRVVVLDEHTIPHILTYVEDAIKEGYDLVLRPVFEGGSEDIQPADIESLINGMKAAFSVWVKSPEHRIEPFYSLYQRRVSRGKPSENSMSGCPFQSDCAFKSISLDPDGSLYICQEMADSKNYKLGNAISGILNENTWRLLTRRSMYLDEECSSCEWKSECGGGCMNEAIQRFNDPFAKTELCPVWKTTFRMIENTLHRK